MVMDGGKDWLLDMFAPPELFRSGTLTPEQADDWQTLTGYDSQRPYYSNDGVDRADARRLLRNLSDTQLSRRWNSSPTVGTVLRSIIKYPKVRANQSASQATPRPDAHAAFSGVLIDDPELIAFSPDVKLGPLPPEIAHLAPELRREYYHHRATCMSSSIYRQRWFAARHRYDLRDALSAPDEIDVVIGPNGTPVLHLWWD